MTFAPDYPFDGEPSPSETREVASGVWWIRMPLPFKLDHINLWMLADGDGWTLVDTGVLSDDIKTCWVDIEKKHDFSNRPVKRLICTHYHPDHMGLAAWLCERHGVEMTTTLGEWTTARLYCLETEESKTGQMLPFFRKAGFSEEQMALVVPRTSHYASVAGMPPHTFNRIKGGDVIEIDGQGWEVMITEGHAVEQACLYCADKKVLISADQILPRITPNVSLQAQEPDADPLKLFLDSLVQFYALPADTLVLPSHNWPFRGLLERLDHMVRHHEERLAVTLAACANPASGIDVLNKMFTRKLDDHQIFFAIGEALAHLNRLMHQGRISRSLSPEGIYLYKAKERNEKAA